MTTITTPTNAFTNKFARSKLKFNVLVDRPNCKITTNHQNIVKNTSIESLLNAPQPMTEWSRTQWEPLAKQIGAAHLTESALNTNRKARQRVRAIEILTDIFSGLDSHSSERLSKSSSSNIRARTAWAIGRYPSRNAAQLLNHLALDQEDYVRVKALDAPRGDRRGLGSALKGEL